MRGALALVLAVAAALLLVLGGRMLLGKGPFASFGSASSAVTADAFWTLVPRALAPLPGANATDVTYPVLTAMRNDTLQAGLNELIRHAAGLDAPEEWQNATEAAARYEATFVSPGVVSLKFERYVYRPQMAHGDEQVATLTLDMAAGRAIALGDLVAPKSFPALAKLVRAGLARQDCPFFETDPAASLTADTPYYLTREALVVVFPKYSIGPGYCGAVEVRLPYASLGGLPRANGTFRALPPS